MPDHLTFRALISKRYPLAIVLIIMAILIPAALFMVIVIYNEITNLSRGQVVCMMGVAGFLSF